MVTKAAYNAVGEKTSSTDGAGNTTDYAYNLDGDLDKTTLPDGTATTATYDLAGRETGQADLDSSGNTIRSEIGHLHSRRAGRDRHRLPRRHHHRRLRRHG